MRRVHRLLLLFQLCQWRRGVQELVSLVVRFVQVKLRLVFFFALQIAVLVKVVSNHSDEHANHVIVIDKDDDQREKAIAECRRLSVLLDQMHVAEIVRVARFELEFDHEKDAQMKQVMTLSEKVQFAREEALREVQGKEGSAYEENTNVSEMIGVVDLYLLRGICFRPNERQEERHNGEQPQNAAWSELQEALDGRIWPFVVGLRNRIQQTA